MSNLLIQKGNPMRDIWIISDTHFSHENILKFKGVDGQPIRSFASMEEMNEHMIERWNSVVKDGDIVYHLGDVFFRQENPPIYTILERLQGRKRLILGNHDNGKSPVLQKYFQKIMGWRHFRADFGLLLTHVPVHPSVLGEGRFGHNKMRNVHGHLHTNRVMRKGYGIPDENYVNVSVKQINYTPVHIEEI